MLSDVLLIWKARSGNSGAPAKIYENHRHSLLHVDVEDTAAGHGFAPPAGRDLRCSQSLGVVFWDS